MKKINDKLFINEDRVQYVEELNDEYFLTTSFGSKISISKAVFDDLKDYEGGGTTYTAGEGIDITDGVISNTYADVEANPELAGTEADLGSIQIGETKYKVGGGKLYQHNCQVEYSPSLFCNFTIINDDSTALTFTKVANYLRTKGLVDNTKVLMATGKSNNNVIIGIFNNDNQDDKIYMSYLSTSNWSEAHNDYMSSGASFHDTIITL